MLERLCLMETTPLQERFAKEAFQLRVQARNTPPSVERYLLVRKARRAGGFRSGLRPTIKRGPK